MFRFKPNTLSSSSKEGEIQSNNNNGSGKLLLLFHQMVKSHPNGITGIEQACKDFRQKKNNNKLLSAEEEEENENEIIEEITIPFDNNNSNNNKNIILEEVVKLHPMGIDGLEQDLVYWKEVMADIFTNQDVLVTIFSFLGPGYYAFVGGVNKFFNKCYTQYFNSLPENQIPYVKQYKYRYRGYTNGKQYDPYGNPTLSGYDNPPTPINPPKPNDGWSHFDVPVMKATATDTFYSAALSSLSCAKFWHDLRRKQQHKRRESSIKDPLLGDTVCQLVALYGSLDVLKWARKEVKHSRILDPAGFPWDRDTCVYASFRGSPTGLQILKYAYGNGCPLDGRSLSAAAAGGCVDTLKFVYKELYPDGQPQYGWRTFYSSDVFLEDPCACALNFGQKDTLKFLVDNNYELTGDCFGIACRFGGLDIVKYLHEKGCPFTANGFTIACGHGKLEMVKYLHNKGCPKEMRAFEYACSRGDLQVVEFLYSINHYPQEEEDRINAMFHASGHLEVLAFLRWKNFAWNEEVCSKAAWHEDLKTLIWLRSQEPPCPWDEMTCIYAAEGNQLDILRYAHENGCPWGEDTCSAAAGTRRYDCHIINSPECLRYAVKNFCPWPDDCHDKVMQVLGPKSLQ